MHSTLDHETTPARAREFAAARRHSLMVVALKWALPALSVAIVAGFATRAATSGILAPQELAAAVGLGSGKLVMDAPVMKGFDDANRPYDVTARTATQQVGTPEVVTLDKIDARVPVGTEGFADVAAIGGIYDTHKETLELNDRIQVRGLSGLDMDLTQASIDMKSGTMESRQPVEVRQGTSSINADTMKVKENGKRVVFDGRVRMVINRSGDAAVAKPAGTAGAAAKPHPVAHSVVVPFEAKQSGTRTTSWVLTEKTGPFATFEAPAAEPIEGLTGFRTLER